MNEHMLLVVEGRYPFGKGIPNAKVQEIQTFSSMERMRQKKIQIIKKSEMITNPSIIRIEILAEQQTNLIYFYQFVPDSIESYLRAKKQGQSGQIWQMTKSLLGKKLNFQLTMLISYLAKMKIETELALCHLGMSEDEKLKLYVNPKSKMGIKSQVQLIISYNHSKDKIIKELQNLYEHLENYQRSGEEYVQGQSANNKESREEREKDVGSRKGRFTSIPKIETQDSRLRQTRTFKESNDFRKRKMSSGQFDLGSSTQFPKFNQKPSLSRNKKDYKYSFQQFATASQPFQNANTSDAHHQQKKNYFADCKDDQNNAPGIPSSKSIKIQLEQTQNYDEKKKRKDSYKVKITTFREYELEGNPANLFGADVSNQADIFQYFAKKAKQDEQRQEYTRKEADVQSNEQQYTENTKLRKETGETHFTNPEPPSPVSPWSIKEKEYYNKPRKSSRNLDLQQRIRQAKQRTSKALNLIKALKK